MIDDVSPHQGFPSKICRATLPFYGTGEALTKAKGKCYSMIDRGQRKPSDMYETPYSLTREFLKTGWANQSLQTLEPMYGRGAIFKVLEEQGFGECTGYDIDTGTDFLLETKLYPQIITNPAFSIAHETILKCKEIATNRFALLLPLTYLQGVNRFRDIWMDRVYPLECIYVFNRYPLMGEPLREDGKFHTGMMSLAWYCWKREYSGEPIIRWLDVNHYVLKKGE